MGQLIDGVWVKGSVSSNDQKGVLKEPAVFLETKLALIIQHTYLKQIDTIYTLATPAHGLTEH